MINLIAGTYFDQRKLLLSRALFERLSRTAREAGSDQRTTAIVDFNLAHCLLHEGHYDEAVLLLKDAFDRLVPLDPADALQSLRGVAWSAFHLGLHDLAVDLHRTVLDARLRLRHNYSPQRSLQSRRTEIQSASHYARSALSARIPVVQCTRRLLPVERTFLAICGPLCSPATHCSTPF